MLCSSGQRCTAVKVVCVMEAVADELVKKVVDKMGKLTVGFPDADSDITPVISTASAEFIEALAMDAQEKGARFHQVRGPPRNHPFAALRATLQPVC